VTSTDDYDENHTKIQEKNMSLRNFYAKYLADSFIIHTFA